MTITNYSKHEVILALLYPRILLHRGVPLYLDYNSRMFGNF